MKILFIEDNDLNREAISEYLELHGYEVCARPDGASFLDVVREFKPDLILLDLKLPEIDGFTLMEQLRQSQSLQIPLVILSALSFNSDKQRAFELGACRFLVKPTMVQDIRRAIQEELK
ncbi:response regulator [Coleofasciculus sp.]|uniref:response regulator n=1 Tax=Coleofasciculus sp. TaxID=3100458 RepID=UPI003A49FBE5